MICQAYDFVELARRTGCNLQMGGSDQWGNIVMGVDLGRRMGTQQLYALTTPLLDDGLGRQDGQDRARRGVAQRGADERLRLLAILAQHRGRRRRLASSSCSRRCRWRRSRGCRRCKAPRSTRPRRCWRPRRPRCCMGASGPRRRPRRRAQTFEQGAYRRGLPTVEIAASELAAGVGVLSAFVKAGLVKSNGEARRQIAGGGLAGERCGRDRRGGAADAGRRQRRRDQAVPRQEAPRAAAAGVIRSQRCGPLPLPL